MLPVPSFSTDELSPSRPRMYGFRLSPDRLMADLKELVAELKKQYVLDKQPITDDDTNVQKLCIKLETILRHGMKEKFSLMGGKKDYWNFISESVPKDETVKYIHSYSEFKTSQGKGRALLRQALMEKTLADTLQRCIIDYRIIREWYQKEAFIVDKRMFESVLHSLYDLNYVEFDLPNKGYDLDRSWPSFARRSFPDAQSRMRRSASQASLDVEAPKLDPVVVAATKVSALQQVLGFNISETTKDILSAENITMELLNSSLSTFYHDLQKWKANMESKVRNLETNLERSIEERKHLEKNNLLKEKDLLERIETLTDQNSDEKLRDLYERLNIFDRELNEARHEIRTLNSSLEESEDKCLTLSSQLNDCQEKYEKIRIGFNNMNSTVENLKAELQSKDGAQKILENKIAELRKVHTNVESKEKELSEKLSESSSLLRAKESELKSLQDSFEKATGLVVGSFKELELELESRLLEKQNHLQVNTKVNQDLAIKYEKLSQELECVQFKLNESREKLTDEGKRREQAEKVISELKQKFAEEKAKEEGLQSFVDKVNEKIRAFSVIETDGFHDDEDGFRKKRDKQWLLDRLSSIRGQLISTLKEKNDYAEEVNALKTENSRMEAKMKELLDSHRTELEGIAGEKTTVERKCEELERDNSKLNVEIKTCNEEMFNMSLSLTDSTEKTEHFQSENTRLKESLSTYEKEIERLRNNAETFEKRKRDCENEIQRKNDQIQVLSLNAESQVTEQQTRIEELSAKLEKLEELYDQSEKEKRSYEETFNSSAENVMKLQDEVKDLQTVKDQEIQALKFQLSTEEMKHHAAIKALSEKMQEYNELIVNVKEQEKLVNEVKLSMTEEKDSLSNEREALLQKCKYLEEKIEEQNQQLEEAEKDASTLETELLSTTQQRDEEKAQKICLANKLESVLSESREREKHLHSTIDTLKDDVQGLKVSLVNITKEKANLWQKSDNLEHELKKKIGERWVDDVEVTKCTECQTEFSFLVRKHHCRVCGKIFCAACSNFWVDSSHSRKKVRSCQACADLVTRRISSYSTLDDSISETSSRRSSISSISITGRNRGESVKEAVNPDDQLAARGNKGNPETKTSRKGTINGDPDPTEDSDDPADGYEVLDERELDDDDENIQFFDGQDLRFESSDIMEDHLLPSLTDDEITKERKEIHLKPKERCLIPVVVGSGKVDLCWEFISHPKDVGYGIAYKKDEESPDTEIETIVPVSTYPSAKQTVFGNIKVEKPGIYILVFDNRISRSTTNDVTCLVGLERSNPPESSKA